MGEGRGPEKEYVLYARESDEKRKDDPLRRIGTKHIFYGMCTFLRNLLCVQVHCLFL